MRKKAFQLKPTLYSGRFCVSRLPCTYTLIRNSPRHVQTLDLQNYQILKAPSLDQPTVTSNDDKNELSAIAWRKSIVQFFAKTFESNSISHTDSKRLPSNGNALPVLHHKPWQISRTTYPLTYLNSPRFMSRRFQEIFKLKHINLI